MNAPSAITCESCRDQLIELVCEELMPERAAEVRAHALRCERCGPELERLSGTLRLSRELPLLAPSPEVERRVMQAARDAIARRARGPAREEPVPSNAGGLTAWFARLGSFAMSPQVAMASVLLLVVGIGLYALPLGHEPESTALRAAEDEADEHTAADPAAAAAAVPLGEGAQEPVPAEALQNSAARRGEPAAVADRAEARKSVPRRELAAEESFKGAKSAPRPFPDAKSATESVSATERVRAAKPKAAGSKALDDFDGFSGGASAPPSVQRDAPADKELSKSRPAPAAAAPAGSNSQTLGAARSGSGSFAPAPPKAAAPAAQPAPSTRARSAEPAPSPVLSESAASSPAKKDSGASKGDASSALSKGIAAIQRGEHGLGESLLTPLLQSSTPSERDQARLWLARSLRERGDCARALEYYRPLTQPVTASRAVLQEAADCHERTGNASAAAKLRSRAALPAKE